MTLELDPLRVVIPKLGITGDKPKQERSKRPIVGHNNDYSYFWKCQCDYDRVWPIWVASCEKCDSFYTNPAPAYEIARELGKSPLSETRKANVIREVAKAFRDMEILTTYYKRKGLNIPTTRQEWRISLIGKLYHLANWNTFLRLSWNIRETGDETPYSVLIKLMNIYAFTPEYSYVLEKVRAENYNVFFNLAWLLSIKIWDCGGINNLSDR